MKYLLLFLLLAPSNFFARLDVGDRQLFSYPGQNGSITYVDRTSAHAVVRWCYHVNICAEPFEMEPGDVFGEEFNRPRLEYLMSGELVVSSTDYEMRALEPVVWLPGMAR